VDFTFNSVLAVWQEDKPMHDKQHVQNSLSRTIWCLEMAALVIGVAFGLLASVAQTAQAQTFTVIHAFTGGADGARPYAGTTMDLEGNLYGTDWAGGAGHGTVYKLTQKNGNWVFAPLYKFAGGNDGAVPFGPVGIGPDGSLYGTTYYGGGDGCSGFGCGTVFNVRPPGAVCGAALCPGTETVLHRFRGEPSDGARPFYGDLIFDQAGSLYGTTYNGGAINGGTVFKLTPSNGAWEESVLYSFGSDGAGPADGVIFDTVGNLYGTTVWGGSIGWGVVFQLTPSGSGWTENVLYSFQNGNDGVNPVGGLIFDQSGNLYGTTLSGGANGGGTVYQLSLSSGGWTLTTLYSFSGGGGSVASLSMDASGNLYCTTEYDGAYGGGSVCKLTRSKGGWSYTSLHDFTGGNDGAYLLGGVTLDANGNLYGTASAGGAYGSGVVWEITP
jgi:uncharacterized repeat protein (TIGR03803 family)